jgi:hypothetical protein
VIQILVLTYNTYYMRSKPSVQGGLSRDPL